MAAIGTYKLKVEVEGDEYSAELTNCRFTSADADSDTVTFADALAGGSKDWSFAGTAVQDAGADSFWTIVFGSPGTEVDIVFMPYGNETPSATQPHFTATATVSDFDGDFLGGDANASRSAKMTFDFSWPCAGRPVKVTTTGGGGGGS